MDNNFYVGIDVGSSKIAVLLAEEKNGKLSIFGCVKGNSAGVERGVIVNVEQAANAIQAVVSKASVQYDVTFQNISVNISGIGLTMMNHTGKSIVSKSEISEEDTRLAIQNAASMPGLNNRQIINNIVNFWTLDRDPTTHTGVVVNDPIGQTAHTLEVNMHIVVTDTQQISNIEKSMHKNDLGLSHIVLNSIASGEAYITQNEKQQGVCLLDIGAQVTNLSVFVDGGIVYNAAIQSAGAQITEKISEAFSTSIQEAERLKIAHGYAQVKSVSRDRLLKFQSTNDSGHALHYLSYQDLITVIEQGYLSLFSLIKQDLENHKLYRSLKSGFVLTGGASQIMGCEDLALKFFKTRSKLGRINTEKINVNTANMDDTILDDPEYGCVIGILLFRPDELDLKEMQINNPGFLGKISQKLKGI